LKSIILTKDDYIKMMEAKERWKKEAIVEAAKRKVEAKRKKVESAHLKEEKDITTRNWGDKQRFSAI
jgi:hypothetical protein